MIIILFMRAYPLLVDLRFQNYLFVSTLLPSCLPHQHPVVFSLSGASLLGKSTGKKRWWAEGIGEDSASRAVDVGVPSVGSQAISNGAAFVPQKRLEEGIRNLSSGFAMGLRRGSTPTASHCPTFRSLSVSRNRHLPQPRLCCTSTEPGVSSLVTNHS